LKPTASYQREGKATLPPFNWNKKLDDPALYVPAPALVDAVNVALTVGQPLLITGEPGTGKTQLAFHLAHYYQLEAPLVFNAQTSSKAADLFYTYDALGHFQYTQNNARALSPEELDQRFIHYNALGAAIKSQKRCVVLIDEIDKAPRDLPNDILYALENLQFRVNETGQQFKTQTENKPIIILTSNSEKNLPDAFLRRVLYYHIPFPTAEELLYILNRKLSDTPPTDLRRIIKHFLQIRELNLKKPPSTAELISWAFLLLESNFPLDRLNKVLSFEEKKKLLTSYSLLAKNKEDLELLNYR
jgi:MoxR-like ATPase